MDLRHRRADWFPEAEGQLRICSCGRIPRSQVTIYLKHRCQCRRSRGCLISDTGAERMSNSLLQQNSSTTRMPLLCYTPGAIGCSKGYETLSPVSLWNQVQARTDHTSLRWLCQRHEPSSQVARWLEIMSAFSYDLEHRAGKCHGNADGLSRQTPCLDSKQCAAIEQRDGGPSRAEIEAELLIK